MIGGSFLIIHRLDLLDMLEVGKFYISSASVLSSQKGLTIGFSVLESSGGNLVFEENIDLTECTVLLMSLLAI
jgi:hypothetical protein